MRPINKSCHASISIADDCIFILDLLPFLQPPKVSFCHPRSLLYLTKTKSKCWTRYPGMVPALHPGASSLRKFSNINSLRSVDSIRQNYHWRAGYKKSENCICAILAQEISVNFPDISLWWSSKENVSSISVVTFSLVHPTRNEQYRNVRSCCRKNVFSWCVYKEMWSCKMSVHGHKKQTNLTRRHPVNS